MNKDFDNQSQVDEAEEELQSVFPGHRIGRWGLDGRRCISVGCLIKQRGNSEGFRKLEAMGWHRGQKRHIGDSWETRVYYITMEKYLR